jgi:putative oxidoreductase
VEGRFRDVLARRGPLLLRISLGVVFVWFGTLKALNASAVGGLVAGTTPFLDASWFVPALGFLEIAMGLAFASGRLLRLVLPVFVIHMTGTLLVLPVLPDVAFEQGNPLMLSIVGEFVVKNLVLLSAGIVVATETDRARMLARTPGPPSPHRAEPTGTTVRARRMIASTLALLTLSLVASSCGGDAADGGSASTGGSTISVRDYEFDPASSTVDVGETVTWIWEGSAEHNVVGDGFQSPDQTSGTFEYMFDRPGTFEYSCTIHPGMDGSVVVKDSA